MKHIVVNELSHFHFHDAEIISVDFENNHMTWEVSHINAMTTNTQNELGVDMCIDEAIMTFRNVTIQNIVLGAYTVHDSDGNLIESKEAVTVEPDEHIDIFKNIVNEYCFIYALEELVIIADGRYKACFSISGSTIFQLSLTIIFVESIISWNEFNGKAWYEDKKRKDQNRKSN